MDAPGDPLAARRRELNRRLAELSPAARETVERLWTADSVDPPPTDGAHHAIPCREPGAPVPMSFAQELLWLMERTNPGHTYNVPRAFRIRGAFDGDTARRALEEVVARHEILRTTYAVSDGRPHQVVHAPRAIPIAIVNLEALPTIEREAAAVAEVRERSRRPFDLENDPQLRVTIIALDETDHVLLLESHHVASDAWSGRILLREFGRLYNGFRAGTSVDLAPLPVQYGDFAAWQRAQLAGPRLEQLLSYWRRELSGTPPVLDLPTDRPAHRGSAFDGAVRAVTLPPDLLEGLRGLGRANNVTLFMTILAAVDVLLARSSGQDDIVIGSPIAGRTTSDTEGIIGYFVNMLVLRATLRGDPTFTALLARVRETVLAAYDHQELPFEKLVIELGNDRTVRRGAPFQVMFTLQDPEREGLKLDGATVAAFGSDRGATKFDLSVFAQERADGLRVGFEYRTDLFDATTIDRMLSQLRVLLGSVVASPELPVSTLPLLDANDRAQILAFGVPTGTLTPPDSSLGQLIAEQARRSPTAIAVEAEDAGGRVTMLTYAGLDARATHLARELSDLRVGPGIGVAICAERSLELVVAMVAVLRSGGYYIPLDPEYPADRLSFMLADAAPRVLLATDELFPALQPVLDAVKQRGSQAGPVMMQLERVDATAPFASVGVPAGRARAEDPAYVIYTSGSTGRPKGVMIPNRAVVNYLDWMQKVYPLAPGDGVLQKAPASFDACIWEFFLPLTTGARLVLARADGHRDPAYLLEAIGRRDVTILQLVPSQLALVLESSPAAPGVLSALKHLFLGGEALPATLLASLRAACPSLPVTNLYGPTEATVYSTHWDCPVGNWNGSEVPIGRPIANTRIYIVDGRMAPVPIGVAGELCIGGSGVAAGYLHHPELTDERFVRDPFVTPAIARLYRTGDRARWLADGTLQYHGRLDTQVKMRGLRIEPGEIEHALAQEPEVDSAVVVVREDAPGDQRLVAYCIPTAGAIPTTDPEAGRVASLQDRLRRSLPEYMVPAVIIWLAAWPLSANGKLDRNALRPPEATDFATETAYEAPGTEMETLVVALCEELLRRQNIGVRHDFFELGGHSLLAMRVLSRVADHTGVRLPLRAFLDAPTLKALAAAIDRETARSGPTTARVRVVARGAFWRGAPAGES